MDMIINTLMVNGVPQATNFFGIAAKGGFLMILLAIISFFAVAIIIEKLISFKRTRKNEEDFLTKLYELIGKKDINQAVEYCDNTGISLARVLGRILSHFDPGQRDSQLLLDTSVQKEVHHLERKLGTLATFAAISPLIGFLGTVTGMVKVFMKIGETGGGVDISLLANGIWEALITTVGGLAVGIICILFYNHLVGRVESISQEISDQASEMLVHLRSKDHVL
ncbi:MAG: MotA/TolQ/ExbB proton channel family protein [Candidatus Cloacimonetes bacterium]|nr:MotA/TolQ/ExbB proton channel family protein [Candidatus Cloacimonadota bacterium]